MCTYDSLDKSSLNVVGLKCMEIMIYIIQHGLEVLNTLHYEAVIMFTKLDKRTFSKVIIIEFFMIFGQPMMKAKPKTIPFCRLIWNKNLKQLNYVLTSDFEIRMKVFQQNRTRAKV